MNFLQRVFRLQELGTDVRTEAIAGCTTFPTMAYILAVNPSGLAEAGMSKEGVFVAIGDIDFSDLSEAIPAGITVLMIPLTFSIGNGILLGVISYLLVKLLCRRQKDLNPSVAILAAIGVVNFAFLV